MINQEILNQFEMLYEKTYFDVSKYDSTDKIKVILSYYGEPVTIELEKVK